MEDSGEKILVIGACGQIGKELTAALIERYGKKAVVASDVLEKHRVKPATLRYERVDMCNKAQLLMLVRNERITQIYLLAAVLSPSGENDPQGAWQVNMDGLLNVLDVAVKCGVGKVFWPSSIAVYGEGAPRVGAIEESFSVPATVYGMSKLSGEYWCKYYVDRYGLDVRSLRYPGLISYKALPGGGTTDYAVDIFYKAKSGEAFTCFLAEDTRLPMMFMADAIRAALELMAAPSEKVKVRTSYNLSALSFSPVELVEEIKKQVPGFSVRYAPDFRQQIADSWPDSVDDSKARRDWGWSPEFSIEDMVEQMLANVSVEQGI